LTRAFETLERNQPELLQGLNWEANLTLHGGLAPSAGILQTTAPVDGPENTAGGGAAESEMVLTDRDVFLWGLRAFKKGYFRKADWVAFQAADPVIRARVQNALDLPFQFGTPELRHDVVAAVFQRHGIGRP